MLVGVAPCWPDAPSLGPRVDALPVPQPRRAPRAASELALLLAGSEFPCVVLLPSCLCANWRCVLRLSLRPWRWITTALEL